MKSYKGKPEPVPTVLVGGKGQILHSYGTKPDGTPMTEDEAALQLEYWFAVRHFVNPNSKQVVQGKSPRLLAAMVEHGEFLKKDS